ncbi:carbohydrate ABC transporter permease [Ktedonosporobacter rubrisoli]|nr:sugar ABC transporter permease [Ktedonosporobacter rubrisoli]
MRRFQRSVEGPPAKEARSRSDALLSGSSSSSSAGHIAISRAYEPGRPGRTFDFRLRMALQAYVFLFPSLLGLVLFLLLPVFVVAGLSFFDWGLLSQPRFIGLQNYISLFQNPVVWRSLGVSVYFVLLNIPLQTLLALLLAIFMNKRLPGLGIYRTLFAVPWMATPVAMGIVWQWIFDPQFGALNNFLLLLGIHGPQWLVSQQWALPSIVIVTLWQNVGYTMLFFLAGLQSIPEHLYEAAYIDGATPFQSFFKVTLPLLNPTMFFVLVTNIIGSFQLFDTVYTMTKGGPAGSTNVLNFYIFQQAFQFFHAGYASALSMVLFAILMFVTLLLALYFHKRTTYDLS